MRYFFNLKDGSTWLDSDGIELGSIDAVKTEAIHSSVDLLKGIRAEHFWSGIPWVRWVTDQPRGAGNTVLSLTFSSSVTS